MEPIWSRWLFAVLSIGLVTSNIDTALWIRGVARATRSLALILNEFVGTLGVVLIVVVPWALGGLHPTREDLTWSIIVAFATAFLSICVLVLTAFDLQRFEANAGPADNPPT
jgi:hypothetical protein